LNKLKPKTQLVGKNIVYLTSCHSTNEYASKLIQNNDFFNGTIVITEDQTAGKGQRGNVWIAEPGKNLTFSIILCPDFLQASMQFNLNMAVSLGIYDALSTVLDNKLKIKWPNDLYYGNQKFGGVLIENSLLGSKLNISIIGIGINVNQDSFLYQTATSLKNILGKEIDIATIGNSIAENIELRFNQLKENDWDLLKKEYLSRLYKIGEYARFEDQNGRFEGTIIDISKEGKLLIEQNDFVKSYDIKEITYLS
jgi:BirA family transcriptional regulator, biotin operon repressor / biotin---[acetyl-CoA-carboxylase] ligase